MNKARALLTEFAHKLELPPDIIAGVPKMELTGMDEFTVEPHHGLLEYSRERVSVMTSVGPIEISGDRMQIKRMNHSRITLAGRIKRVDLCGKGHDE